MNRVCYAVLLLISLPLAVNASDNVLSQETLRVDSPDGQSVVQVPQGTLDSLLQDLRSKIDSIFFAPQDKWVEQFARIMGSMRYDKNFDHMQLEFIAQKLRLQLDKIASNTLKSFIMYFNQNHRFLAVNGLKATYEQMKLKVAGPDLASSGSLLSVFTPRRRSTEISKSSSQEEFNKKQEGRQAGFEGKQADPDNKTTSLEGLVGLVGALKLEIKDVRTIISKMSQAQEWLRIADRYYADGRNRNYAKAHEHYEKAAHQDYDKMAQAWAYYMLGEIYFYGYGVPQDSEIAHTYFTAAFQQEYHSEASARAEIMLTKIAKEQDAIFMEQRFKEGQNSFEVCWEKTDKLLSSQQPVATNQFFTVITEVYSRTRIDFIKARDCFEPWTRARGNAHRQRIAYERLGEIYFQGGYGITRDLERACDYFEKAKDIQIDAASNFDPIFALTRYVQIKYELQYYNEAYLACIEVSKQPSCSSKKANALVLLGIMRLEGRGTQDAYKDAKQNFDDVIGYASYDFYMSDFPDQPRYFRAYFSPKIVDKELEAAFAQARAYLGKMYQNGMGVPVDHERAFKLFLYAARQNYSSEAKRLGESGLSAMSLQGLPKKGILTRLKGLIS